MGLALSVRPILSKFTENFYVRSRNNYEYHIHFAIDLALILMFYFTLTCERCGDGHIGIETSGRVPWGENSSRIGLFRTRCINDHWDRFVFVFFSRVFKRIRWQLKVPGRELFTLVSSLLVSSHGQVEVRVGNILGSASPKAPVCVIRKPVCAKSSANFEANWKLVCLKDHCGNINLDSKSFPLP